jgi:GNAT superfamily N-acetyltransferase
MIELLRLGDPHFSLDSVKTLFAEYQAALPADLRTPNFEAELDRLPGRYAPNQQGQLYLLCEHGQPLGCAALRAMASGIAELKRLYVVPAAQGRGLAKYLLNAMIKDARAMGYEQLYLDSSHRLAAARKLYEGLGFVDIPPYNQTPFVDVYHMGLSLQPVPQTALLAGAPA